MDYFKYYKCYWGYKWSEESFMKYDPIYKYQKIARNKLKQELRKELEEHYKYPLPSSDIFVDNLVPYRDNILCRGFFLLFYYS